MKITKANVADISTSILNISNKLTKSFIIGKDDGLTVIRSFITGEPLYQVYASGKLLMSFAGRSVYGKDPAEQIQYVTERLLASYIKSVEGEIEDIIEQSVGLMVYNSSTSAAKLGDLELTTTMDGDSGIKVYRMFRCNTEIVTLSDIGRSTSGWAQFLLKLKEEVLEEVLEGRFELPE